MAGDREQVTCMTINRSMSAERLKQTVKMVTGSLHVRHSSVDLYLPSLQVKRATFTCTSHDLATLRISHDTT